MRFFNTGGPCNPQNHYMLPATQRLEAYDVHRLIRQESYFVVHAPRQVGLSMETGAAFRDDPLKAEQAILGSWKITIQTQVPVELHPPSWFPEGYGGTVVGTFLSQWALVAARPLVIFLDEIDALEDDVLVSVLRQLRAGYSSRPQGFPASLALIGLRDVCDFKVASGGSQRLRSPSPFNIAVRSITLRNFTEPEVRQPWLNPDGSLNPDQLIDAFLIFWRQHGQPLLRSAPYHEIAPHLVLMAYLHRVVNGNGIINREYAIGSGKMDLYIRYSGSGKVIEMAMELKVWRDGRPDPLPMG